MKHPLLIFQHIQAELNVSSALYDGTGFTLNHEITLSLSNKNKIL